MPIDFNSSPSDAPTGKESESPMFAGVPSWERGKKRGVLGGLASSVAPEPRSFAADAPETATSEAMTGEPRHNEAGPDVGNPAESAFAATPSYASRPSGHRSSSVPIAIAAGIILVGGLAAAGWYYTQPHTPGVAELTPGSATTTTATATTVGAPLPGEEVAQNTAPQSAAPEAAAPAHATATATTTTHRTSPASTHRTTTTVARARPAPRSASDTGADAATTAPIQQAAPKPAPAAPPLVLNVPSPTQTAPPQTAPATVTPVPTQTAPPQTPPAETPPQ